MANYSRSRALRDFVYLISLCVVLIFVFSSLDAHEYMHVFFENNEYLEADDIVLAVMATGACGFGFGFRRLRELTAEVASRLKAERDINWIATHDVHTRLPNRAGLTQVIQSLKAQGKAGNKFAAMSLEIQEIDFEGLPIGVDKEDDILITIADYLRQAFAGAFLFRLERRLFYAAMEGVSDPDWEVTVSRALTMVRHQIKVDGLPIAVRAHAGMARYPEQAANVVHLLRCTQTALNASSRKENSEPVWFAFEMDEVISRRANLDKTLRTGMKSGEVVPYYQPMINLASGKIIGFEALARWKKADGSFVPPGDFIPLAEETGFIVELSEHLFRAACRDALHWPPGIGLAFNVSPRQLDNPGYAADTLAILSEIGFPPKRLELEITESAVIKDIDQAMRIMSELQLAQISLAIDDFGTGYSSLSQLARLKFDKLKIDRSFISSFQSDERQAKIVRAMIGLGKGLGMKTIAEGVESQTQANTLCGLGCHQGQGFLFSRAVSSAEALDMLRNDTTFEVEPRRAQVHHLRWPS